MITLNPSRFGELDGDSMHLPVPGLLADYETGSAVVAMADEFLDSSPRLRAQLAQKWMRGMQSLADAAYVQMFREFSSANDELCIVEQIDQFRRSCAEQGMTCPGDLPVLLQRY